MALKGERLDKRTYPVIETIAEEGNSAICYKVWHDVFKTYQVQKTVNLLGLSDSIAYDEPNLLNSLSHDHITAIREAQWDPEWKDRYVTFTMPFYEGGSLNSALADGTRFSLGESLSLFDQLLDALHYLHVERGIVHRDIKPGNLFLSADRTQLFLGDLGSAAPLINGIADFRGGTPLYKAPEQRLGAYTPASDLYSAGLVLLEMLGEPFDYANIDYDHVDRRLQEGRRTLPGSRLLVPPHVPDQLRTAVNKLIEITPTRRPQTAAAASRSLLRVPHYDWRPTRGLGDVQVWQGRAVSRHPRQPDRELYVSAEPLLSGPYSGKLKLVAWQRKTGAPQWIKMASISTRINPTDHNGLRDFFKSISRALPKSIAL